MNKKKSLRNSVLSRCQIFVFDNVEGDGLLNGNRLSNWRTRHVWDSLMLEFIGLFLVLSDIPWVIRFPPSIRPGILSSRIVSFYLSSLSSPEKFLLCLRIYFSSFQFNKVCNLSSSCDTKDNGIHRSYTFNHVYLFLRGFGFSINKYSVRSGPLIRNVITYYSHLHFLW